MEPETTTMPPPTTPATPATATRQGITETRLRSDEMLNLYNIATFRGNAVDCQEGPSVKTFIRQIDEARQLLGWSNEKAAIQAKLRLSDELKESWKVPIDDPQLPGRRVPNWDLWEPPEGQEGGVKWALMDEFGSSTSTKNSRLKVQRDFNNCMQNQGEGVKAYLRRIETTIRNLVNATMPSKLRECPNYPDIYAYLVDLRLRTGMRQSSQSFLETFHKNEEKLENIVKLVVDFEATEAGSKDVPSGSARTIAAVETDNPEEVAALSRNPANNLGKAPTAPGATCSYCGIKNHTAAMCFRKQRDEAAGIYRDKCEGYPLKSRKEMKKERQRTKKAAAILVEKQGQALAQQQQQQQQQQQAQQQQLQHIQQQSTQLAQQPQQQSQVPLPGHGSWQQESFAPLTSMAAINASAAAGYNPYQLISNYNPLYSPKN